MVLFSLFSEVGYANEWFSFDEAVKHNFSESAAGASDLTLGATQALLIYSNANIQDSELQSIAWQQTFLGGFLNYALTNGVKTWSRRARPYTYNSSPRAVQYTRANRDDASRSFYSGHASTAFLSSYSIMKTQNAQFDREAMRSLISVSFFLSSSTAFLRVHAGKHFYSDILVGSIMGVLTTEAAHILVGARNRFHALQGDDFLYAGTGIILGALWPQFTDFGANLAVWPAMTDDGSLALNVRRQW